MRFLRTLLLLLCAVAIASAQEEQEELTATVQRFAVKGGASDGLGIAVSEAIQSVITAAGKFRVKDRDTIEAEMKRMERATAKKLEYGGDACDNVSCLQQMAGALQISYLIYGTINRFGGRYAITINILSMREGERGTVIDTQQKEATEDGVLLAARFAAIEMVAKIRIQGAVEQREGNIVYINLGTKNKIDRGSQFDVYRIKQVKLASGKTFNDRSRIGKLNVIQAEEGASKCDIIEGRDAVGVNDVVVLIENVDQKVNELKRKMEEEQRKVDEEKRREAERQRIAREREAEEERIAAERRRSGSSSSAGRNGGFKPNGMRFGMGVFVPSDREYFGTLYPVNYQFNGGVFGMGLFSYYLDGLFMFNATADREDMWGTSEWVNYSAHPEFRRMGTNVDKAYMFMGVYSGGLRININLWMLNIYLLGGVNLLTIREAVKIHNDSGSEDEGNWYMGLGWEAGGGVGFQLLEDIVVYAEGKYGTIIPIPVFNMGTAVDKNGATFVYDPFGLQVSIGAAILFD
ncbi:MAG: hypothetical protein AABZ39_12010 [Spirochaetota bacterium]